MISVREWEYYPIEMPVDSEGRGPATMGVDAVRMTYEVWDQLFNVHASFDNLPDAINEAMRLNLSMHSVDKKDFPFRRPRGSGNGEAARLGKRRGCISPAPSRVHEVPEILGHKGTIRTNIVHDETE